MNNAFKVKKGLIVQGSGSASSPSILTVDGNNGRLFEVSDDLSDSLFSVNTIAGLPVFEIFADNRIIAGAFNQNDFVISGSRVGIGTASPRTSLDIASSINGTNLIVENDTHNAILQILASANAKNSEIWFGDAGDDNIGKIDYDHLDNSLDFVTNNSTRMTITSGGNVGIGDTAPESLLTLRSNGATTIRLEDTNTTSVGSITRSATSAIEFVSSVNSRDFIFRENNNELMRIEATGNVGIGTTAPSEKFVVNGPILWQGALVASQTNSGVLDRSGNDLRIRAYGATAGTGNLVFRTGGGGDSVDSEAMRITSEGDVGIGTTSPSTLLELELEDSTTISDSTFSQNVLRIENTSQTDGSYSAIAFAVRNSNNNVGNASIAAYSTSTNSSAGLAFQTRNGGTYAERLRIEPDGNVGIGTTTPSEKLEVVGNISASNNIYVGNDIISTGEMYIRTGTNLRTQGNVITFSNAAGSSEYARFESSGRLGIGTTSPSALLDIDGTGTLLQVVSAASREFFIDTTNPDHLKKNQNLVLSADPSNTHANTKIVFRIDDDEKLTVSGSGNVGIGTTSPSTKLDVTGAIRTTTDLYVGDQIIHDGDTNTYTQFHAADQWRVVTGGTERLEVNNSNVTITRPLILTNQPAKDSEATALVIDGSSNVGTRELGSNAFTDTTYLPESEAYFSIYENSWSSTPTARYIKIDFPFVEGSGGSIYYVVDIIGYAYIGTMDSAVSYRVYAHTRSNGTTTNSIQFEVYTLNEGTTREFTFSYKTVASSPTEFYIEVPTAFSGLEILSLPVDDGSLAKVNSTWISSSDTAPTGTTGITKTKYLTTADEGSGNGIDADTVDGLQSTSFLRSDADDTAGGKITFNDGDADPLVLQRSSQVGIKFDDTSSSPRYLGVNSGNLRFGSDLNHGNNAQVFTEDYHPNADTWTTDRTLTIGDTGKSVDGSGDVTWSRTEIGITKTNIDALGINAGTLQGSPASSFAFSRVGGDINSNTDVDNNNRRNGMYRINNGLTSTPINSYFALTQYGNESNVVAQQVSHFQTGETWIRAYNTSWSSWRKLWDDQNHGTGSGLDADLLDGQQGTYYLDYDNFSNTPTIPTVSGTSGQVAYFNGTNSVTSESNLTWDAANNRLGINIEPSYPLQVSGNASGTSIYASDNIVAYSDISVKENIRPIENSLERVEKSRGVLYDRKDTGVKDNIGFIAQELEEQFPELVITNPNGTKAVNYQNATAVLFEAVKELKGRVDSQEERLSRLEKLLGDS